MIRREREEGEKGEKHEQEHGLETFHLSSNNHVTSLSLGPKLLAVSGFPDGYVLGDSIKCEM